MLIPSTSATLARCLIVAVVISFSHLIMVTTDTPASFANCSCVNPRSIRQVFNRIFKLSPPFPCGLVTAIGSITQVLRPVALCFLSCFKFYDFPVGFYTVDVISAPVDPLCVLFYGNICAESVEVCVSAVLCVVSAFTALQSLDG